MSYNGLSTSEVKESLKKYGSNKLFIKKRKTFFGLLIESLGDPIIKILLISLVIKVVFLFKDADYFETLGILVAIFLSTFISTISEYGNEQAFKKLEEESNNKQVKVKRNNIIELISIDELVVGDIVFLNAGDQVYADILLLEGELSVDKSKLNGESKEENISTGEEVLRGMSIYSGKAIGRVTKVGNNTIYGSIIKELQEETPKSPLKLRLTDLAKTISKIGYIGAFLAFITYLFSKVVIANNYDIYLIKETLTNIPLMINYLIYGITLFVTIIVVAVPEGLPMMISLVLRSNMKKMLKDNVLVRKLVGIESSGSLNILYTDKTGTLTKGKLNISKIITYDNCIYNTYSDLDNDLEYRSIIEKSFIWNNDGMIIDNKIVGGNSTDVAFLKFINKNINRPQVIKDEPFNSFNKYRSITVKENNELITYYKGSEKLIDKCLYYVNKNGDIKYLLDKDKLYRIISKYTNIGNVVTVNLFNMVAGIKPSFVILILLSFVVVAISNIFVPSLSTKWTLFVPKMIPLFMKSNITPEFTGAIFRLASSVTNLISPIYSYFVIFLGFIGLYSKSDFTIGKCYKMIFPYFIAILILWLFIIFGWYVLKAPIGPNVFPTI